MNVIPFPDKLSPKGIYRCAYCPSLKIRVVAVDLEEARRGWIYAVVKCQDCEQLDRPSCSVEEFMRVLS